MSLSLFAAKSANIKNACIKSIQNSYTRSAYANNTSARNIYTRNILFTISTCIKSAGPDGTNIEGISRKNACIRGVYTVKY